MNAGSPVSLTDQSLFETALQYSANAIALCETVRDDAGTIVDFRYLLINQRYEHFTTHSAQEIQGKLATTLFPNALAHGIWQHAAEVVLTGQVYRQEIHYTTTKGYTGWFDVTIDRWEERGIVISFMEITDQKVRLLAERQQAELLREVVYNSLNGIWVLEAVRSANGSIIDFRFLLSNRAGNLLPTMSAEDVSKTTLLKLLPATHRMPFPGNKTQTIFERYQETVNTGVPITYDIDYQQDGLTGWYWFAVNKLNDGLILTFLDISDLKQAQQQLERSNRELRQTNQNLEQFAYVSSHDLQEPLRKIQSFGDLLTSRLGDSADQDISDIVRRMQGSAQRMQGLVKDLLAYSRVTTRQEEFGLVLLSRALTESLDDLQPLIEEKHAVIEVDSLPAIIGNAAQLRQLFFCLINNALKFHQAGKAPRIDISATVAASDDLPLTLAETGRRYVAVSIEDDGIGFDEKYTDRIFTIFQRLHGRGKYDGTGIGLALARKITENHSGTITVRSKPGHGATFTVWLPTH
ncbi:sensor histidine kinase [Spirosoma utsteinense]|uniref:histidine kinase n=1 Tax=Spirosoma utsteinense TaxID=2585773 RepID=A0ABR6W8N3_9BACT|nr:PAS domain-containing sensor histidine kinase [Spirosoma utsteinense]MBC3787244.1 signal transduction histidine kinase [Spirosoma utsteinense]MBC3792930.1 signal transduction histidine kinase [Spirosoma utsteinense]